MKNRKLVLENGQVFEGLGFGSMNEAVAEIVFNTAVVGYQEIISDSANCNKLICLTYPLIGNYGMTDEDYESKHICAKGLIVREYNEFPSNFRYTRTLDEVMEENNISGISDIDTRSLMKAIRDEACVKGLICDIEKPIDECLEVLKNYQEEENLVSLVSSKKVWYSRTPNPVFNIAVIDLGTKINMIKKLNSLGCNVIVFPYNTTKEEILKYKPNGLFVSSGPGKPEALSDVVALIKSFIGVMPIMGVALGCNLIASAYGVKSVKMNKGHHGANYPVRNLETNAIEITSQNRAYRLDLESFNKSSLSLLYKNVIDSDIEGFIDSKKKVLGIQFEPGTPIDENSEDVFKKFVLMMNNKGGKKNA